MRPEFNYTNEEQTKIALFKLKFLKVSDVIFCLGFIPKERHPVTGWWHYYDHVLVARKNGKTLESIVISENVEIE